MAKIKSHFDREIKEQVRQILANAKYSIRVAMFSLNEDSLFRLLCRKAEIDKIEVEVLLDRKQFEQNENILTSSISRLENSGGSVLLYNNTSGTFANMHNKFCIIDDKIVITGSYNWTNNASNFSNENVVIIDDFVSAFDFGSKFNKLKAKGSLHNEDAELPIFLTTSKNVVKYGEQIEVSWKVPNADTLTLNDEIVENIGSATKIINENTKFRLSALNSENASSKTVSVTVAEKPIIMSFKSSERVVRRGQSVNLSWEVKGASKIKIEQLGEVQAIDSREHFPQTDTTYKLIAYDVWGEEVIKEFIVRVPDFKVPAFENIKIVVPQMSSITTFEIKKPNFANVLNTSTLNEILKKQAEVSEARKQQIKRNHTTFYKGLKKNIREKSTQIRFNRIKDAIIDRTENVLNQLIVKLRKSR